MAKVSALRLSSKQVQELSGFRPVHTALKITLFFAILAALTAVAWQSQSTVLRWLCYAGIGYMWMAVVTFMHEATHNTLFETRWHNYAFGVIAMTPLMASYLSFKEDHLNHHRYNRSPEDPDAFTMGKRGPLDFFAFYAYVLVGGVLTLLHFNLLYPIRYFNRRQWAYHLAEMGFKIACAWALVSWAQRHGIQSQVLEVWWAPMIFFSLLNSMRFICEHYGTPWNQGKLAGTRTIVSNPLNSFFWNNINWHAGHHLYPRVPYYNLVKLHHLIQPEIRSVGTLTDRSYLGVFWDALVSGPESEERLRSKLERRYAKEEQLAAERQSTTGSRLPA